MDTISAKHVIIGGGAVGTAAAYHLAARGEPLLLVEQFGLGHPRGSSHGDARITRHSYADRRYARLMPDAFRAWRELEAEAGTPLYVRTGGVSFGPPGGDYVRAVATNLREMAIPHRRMSGRELNRKIPAFSVPADYDVVFEPDAGLLAASRALAVQVELARQLGGDRVRILENCAVLGLDLESDRPTILADGLRIVADRLVVAAGSWVGRLLPTLACRVRPTRQRVLYLDPDPIDPFAIGNFPAFIFMGTSPGDAYYGMPTFLGGGVKVARHGGPETDPDRHDPDVDPAYVDEVRGFLRGHSPGLAEAPVRKTEVCLYTVADDENFLLGPLPGRPDVLVASPCSGHGFKFSCLIGRVLADLAQLGHTDLDVGFWSPPAS